jgi:hypothetical protein
LQAANTAQQTAANAAQQAATAQKVADAATAAAGGDAAQQAAAQQEKLNRLPKKKPGCSAIVSVDYITPTEVSLSPADAAAQGHVLSTDAGQNGRVAINTAGRTETVSFNSLAAANSYADSIEAAIAARFESYGSIVGQEESHGVTRPDTLSNPDGGSCSEPPADQQAMTAYDDGRGAA